MVRAAGNQADTPDQYYRRWGRVGYNYSISSHEVTNAQYAAFLNSVAVESDPHELWLPSIQPRWPDEIRRFDNGRGGYRYEVVAGKQNNPVVRVTHRSFFRMMNWLHNGMQNDLSTTDYGAYDTSQWGFDQNGLYTDSMSHEPNARFWLVSEDEWYKAAYFDPNRYGAGEAGYWTYPTTHDDEPDTWFRMDADPRNSAIYDAVYSEPVGSIPLTYSPWGVYDMAGNAREILASWYTDGEPYGIAYVTRGSDFFGVRLYDDKAHRDWQGAYFGGTLNLNRVSFRIVSPIPSAGSGMILVILSLMLYPRKRR
ncbi:MAG: SUMF1/EgtB/PvdO family nonheme iron enzyme [Phycisphaerales bacterium]|nr:SUMF1/EgtB/PvdO family nonheme iron enzyme [Phycisphaerales bacterium]